MKNDEFYREAVIRPVLRLAILTFANSVRHGDVRRARLANIAANIISRKKRAA